MNISTKITDEQIDPNKPDGGYEWWYFDALSTDLEWGIVVIFYQGNPFSPKYIMGDSGAGPENYPAISISLYKNGKHHYYGFEEFSKFQFGYHDEPLEVNTGNNSFKRITDGSGVSYKLELDQHLASGHSLSGTLDFSSTQTSTRWINELAENDHHFWNLLLPKAEVRGELSVNGSTGAEQIEFYGNGYHDHNTGHEPMKDSFRNWYWGRIHFGKSTLIYYVMNNHDDQQHKAWLIDNQNQKRITVFDRVEAQDHTYNVLGLRSARKIILHAEGTEATIQSSRVIDNGPFYQRFLCDAIIQQPEGTSVATGISEYIVPERIYNKKYWWMVHMRLRYLNDKPHWVQRSKRLYEWTW